MPFPEEQEAAHDEDGRENAEGADQPEDSLLYSVIDEKVVGVVRLVREKVEPLVGAFQQIGVPEEVRSVSYDGTKKAHGEIAKLEPRTLQHQAPRVPPDVYATSNATRW